ncbi:uncharacterized protein EV420DRAFT_1480197 [Desarmillaria tabescens]|uniref:Uncharacterized protein n=1 Tax=Armillaria tabescens TaxID=1929756 RepID=A0AA39N4X4_ARMTA|nr:uncharacterized protein EV420DRAFT_1480197 [Desarmillaria tabescens]KAK0458027.1 hypothetical protein EV420DRAFT_1480197 [Desarmillaria tabescens]
MPPGEATYIWDIAGTKKFWAKGEYCVHWIIVHGKPTMYTFECLQDHTISEGSRLLLVPTIEYVLNLTIRTLTGPYRLMSVDRDIRSQPVPVLAMTTFSQSSQIGWGLSSDQTCMFG